MLLEMGDSLDDERKQRQKPSPLKVDGDGLLQVPRYKTIGREQSKLLQACWDQNWEKVLSRCFYHPEESFYTTQHTDRTALHLSTFNQACPLSVAQALLKANRHMILVEDGNWYTPLHNVAFFPGESLVKLFCDTAIMVEQELQGQGLPPISGTSPLFLAAKRAAPLETLRYLLETRHRTNWIAPSTGGEPYWEETLDEYSSPIEILLRNRAHVIWLANENLITDHQTELKVKMRRIAWERLQSSESVSPVLSSPVEDKREQSSTDLRIDANQKRCEECDWAALSLWVKVVELLAEHVPKLENENPGDCQEMEFAIVHAIASAKVPVPNLLTVALRVFPEQALLRDERGILPLHHVLIAKHQYATEAMTAIVVAHAPESANHCVDLGGSTPLAFALRFRHSVKVVESLLAADSDTTLSTMDPVTKLYPFALAASQDYDLTTIFKLLISHPQVLK